MKIHTIVSLLAAQALLAACVTRPADSQGSHSVAGGDAGIIHFAHQDAAQAANRARARFGSPPMTSTVEVVVDRETNSWVVRAGADDLARVQSIAAEYDQQ